MTTDAQVVADDPRTYSLRLWRRLARRVPSAVSYVTIVGLLATIPGLAVPMLNRVFLNQYLVAGNTTWIVPVVLGLLASTLLAGVLIWLQWRVVTFVAVRFSATESTRLAWHLLRLPTPVVDAMTPGNLTARGSALEARVLGSALLVTTVLVNVITLLVYSVALILLDLRLGTAAVLVVLASMAVSIWLLRRRQAVQREAAQAQIALAQQTTALVTAIESVKAAAAEQWTFGQWGRMRSEAASATSRLEADGQRLGLVTPLTQALGLGLILAIGALMVFNGSLDLGTLVASQGVLVALLVPAAQLVYLGILLELTASAYRLVDEVEQTPVDIEVKEQEQSTFAVVSTDVPVRIDVADLCFGHRLDLPPLFDGLSLRIDAGQWLAVVGSSGSGKSTLSRLLVGELQPWSGDVLLDGVSRLEVPRHERAAIVGYVPQYPTLLPGTIADNITMFDETIDVADIREALRLACVDQAVAARPAGLLEQISPTGHGFSGGELQRLAIARALVRRPSFVVLDEATSALDPLVEVDVAANIRGLGCTCLVVAHRLSTVRDADSIVVLEHGSVVQNDTFDNLRHAGRFAELVDA